MGKASPEPFGLESGAVESREKQESNALYKWVQLVKVLDVFPEIPGIFVKIIVSGVRNEIWRFFHFSIARVAKPLRAGMGLVPRK